MKVTTEDAPRLVGLGERIILDSSESQRRLLVRADNGSYLRLSESAHQMLVWTEEGISCEEIATRFSRRGDRTITASEVESARDRLHTRIRDITTRPPRSAADNFLFRFRLVPIGIVQPLARWLSVGFQPWVVWLLIPLIAFAGYRAIGYHIQAADVQRDLGPAMLVTMISLLVHEFGHAAACARFGAAPEEIGAGVYLMYPAFYSNVSDAWRLSRWQRVAVDVGGLYFQSLAAVGVVLLYELTGWSPLRASLLLIWGTMIFALNPFFKFDGYWIVSDALGVVNLGEQRGRILRFAKRRLQRQVTEPLPWPPFHTLAVALFSCGAFLLFLRFLVHVGPSLWHSLTGYTGYLASLVHGDTSNRTTQVRVSEFIKRTYLFACTARIAWMLLNQMRVKSSSFVKRRRANSALTNADETAAPSLEVAISPRAETVVRD